LKKPLQYFLSFLFDIKIVDSQSTINPQLKVLLRNGRLILNANRANYSYDGLHKVFQIVFDKIGIKKTNPQSVLILGFGAGSVATILQKELQINCSITGVEADEEVIKLSKVHFQKDFINTTLFIDTAENFIQKCAKTFDLIVVDVFIDLQVPVAIQEREFLDKISKLLNPKGQIIYNFVLHSKESRKQFEMLREASNNIFSEVNILRVLDFNRVLIMAN